MQTPFFSIACILLVLLSQCRQDNTNPIALNSTPDSVELFAENLVSTSLYERDIAISPDGNEIVFTLSDYKQTKRCLVMLKKIGNNWGKKEILDFSGLYQDIEPFYSVDGNTLYFASNRPIENNLERKDYNIWVTKRTELGWSQPEPLPAIINSENDEFFPSISDDNHLYFTSVRQNGIGREDIFISRYIKGAYAEPEPLDTFVNSIMFEFNAYISPDEKTIVFSSYGRTDDLGGGDLYFSKKDESGKWMPAINMGKGINSEQLDFCPFIDFKSNNFYFTSERAVKYGKKIERIQEIEDISEGTLNGMGNIYRIGLDKTNLK